MLHVVNGPGMVILPESEPVEGRYHPISAPSIFTLILIGNGDIPVALVIRGTAVRPRSDEV